MEQVRRRTMDSTIQEITSTSFRFGKQSRFMVGSRGWELPTVSSNIFVRQLYVRHPDMYLSCVHVQPHTVRRNMRCFCPYYCRTLRWKKLTSALEDLQSPSFWNSNAEKKLIVPESENQCSSRCESDREIRFQLTQQAYSNIICPTRSDLRFVKLNQQFKKLEPAACRDPHIYKLLMMNLIAFERTLSSTDPSGFVLGFANGEINKGATAEKTELGTLPVAVLPPITKKRKRTDDINNKSALKRNPGKCKECLAKGLVPSDNHRSFSKRCPLSKSQ